MKRLNAIIAGVVLLTALPLVCARAQASEWNQDSLRQLVANEVKALNLNAAIVGVWVDGKERFLEASGHSMINVPATADMRFRSGGITLTSLCVILLQLAEEGVVKLDDPIAQWRPDLPKARAVTLRMLADCTAGYPDYVPVDSFINGFLEDVFREWTDEELIAIALAQPFSFEPGEGWSYSHTNFVILGGILEKITGKPLTEIFQERIFQPLGLSRSFYAMTPAIAPPLLHAYSTDRDIYEESTFWNPSWTGPSGRLVSTVAEVGRIGNALTGPGLLSEEFRKELVAPHTVGIGPNTKERFYAMGVGVIGDWIIQNPNMNGFHTFMASLPGNTLTIVVTTTIANGYEGSAAPSTEVFRKIAALVAPDNPFPLNL